MVIIAKSRLAYVSWHYCYSPKSSFISVCHCIMVLSVFPNRRLFRLARVSRHYLLFLIAVYFGLPVYHCIIGIFISPFILVSPKYHGIGIHPISSNILLLSHTTLRLSIMATQLFQVPKLHHIRISTR